MNTQYIKAGPGLIKNNRAPQSHIGLVIWQRYSKTPTPSLYKKVFQKILEWSHAARLAMLKPAAKDVLSAQKVQILVGRVASKSTLGERHHRSGKLWHTI